TVEGKTDIQELVGLCNEADNNNYRIAGPSKNIPSPFKRALFWLQKEDDKIRNVDGADRVKLVFHPSVLKFFYESILIDRWHMVEVCLREAKLSKEDGERLKKAFLKCNGIGRIEWENRKLKRFFDFLDETNESADKEKKAQKRKLENCCAE
ncbi:hypothetical protein AVEN_233744-1, partial [Araneus ventricosus]